MFFAQTTKYADGKGGYIVLPLGNVSFADEIIEYKKGNPQAIAQSCDSSKALYKPDYTGVVGNFTSLGCGGSLTVKFTNNALIDIPGPDLYIFEVGKFIEKTSLEISTNGLDWLYAGEIAGGIAAIDIQKISKKEDVFYYVKLTDLRTECRGKWPGADIDAIAAIGAGEVISLQGSVLFDHNQYTLKNDALKELEAACQQIEQFKPTTIIIEGHTDNSGTDELNYLLSENRANAVAGYIIKQMGYTKENIIIKAYGSLRPISENNTKEGKEKNRRVNIILIP